jgi:hypothetical protein
VALGFFALKFQAARYKNFVWDTFLVNAVAYQKRCFDCGFDQQDHQGNRFAGASPALTA